MKLFSKYRKLRTKSLFSIEKFWGRHPSMGWAKIKSQMHWNKILHIMVRISPLTCEQWHPEKNFRCCNEQNLIWINYRLQSNRGARLRKNSIFILKAWEHILGWLWLIYLDLPLFSIGSRRCVQQHYLYLHHYHQHYPARISSIKYIFYWEFNRMKHSEVAAG